jgi:transposase InsO family protein
MKKYYPKIKKAASQTRNPELRAKLLCLLRGLEEGDIARVCEPHGISRRTWYRWLHRLVEGKFDPSSLFARSRRPRTHPRQIEGELQEKILSFRKEFRSGAAWIAWHLSQWGWKVSATGVYKVLKRAGVVFGRYRTKKKNPHTKRYELDRPGQGFQVDIKYVPYRIEGQKAYVFSAIDDCTRWRFSYAYRAVGYDSAIDFAKRLIQACPFSIESIQTDNDITFTNRFLAKSVDYNVDHPFESLLRTLKILHKLIPPGIKELNGKIERLHKTDMDSFYWKIPQHISWNRFQKELQSWCGQYNYDRPHSSLNMRTPMQRLQDFGLQSAQTKRNLEAFASKIRIPLSLALARKIEQAGFESAYFEQKRPQPVKRQKDWLALAHFMAQPLPSVCHICGTSTEIPGDSRSLFLSVSFRLR